MRREDKDEAIPCVSVIIPSYNRADCVASAIQSVTAQDYRPLDILIIDDGSVDNTQEVVQDFLQETTDLSIRYIYQPNGGVSAARNHGLALARGEYISFLDSDDVLLPHKIKHQVLLMQKEHADLCYGKAIYQNELGEWLNSIAPPSEDTVRQFLFGENLTPSACFLFKRGLLEEHSLRFREGCSLGEDNEFLVKALFFSRKSVFLDAPLLRVRLGRSDGLSKFHWDKLGKTIFIYQEILQWFLKQDIPEKRKREYRNVICQITIPYALIQRLWAGRKEKQECRKYLALYGKYLPVASVFHYFLPRKDWRTVVKYGYLRLFY